MGRQKEKKSDSGAPFISVTKTPHTPYKWLKVCDANTIIALLYVSRKQKYQTQTGGATGWLTQLYIHTYSYVHFSILLKRMWFSVFFFNILES